jgi:hypothetical protein
MLDDKDIEKLIKVFATRDEVATQADIKALRSDFNELLNSIDAYGPQSRYVLSRDGHAFA